MTKLTDGITRRNFLQFAAGATMAGAGILAGVSSASADEATSSSMDSDAKASSQADQASSDEDVVRVFDLHCDTVDLVGLKDDPVYSALYPMDEDPGDSLYTNNAAVAVDRMLSSAPISGWSQCYAIWMPDACTTQEAPELYRRAAAWFHDQVSEYSDAMTQVLRASDGVAASSALERAASSSAGSSSSKVRAYLTIENGLAIGEDISMIDEIDRDGVRIVTLTWNGENPIGSGYETSHGLTDFGFKVVSALEDHNIVVDVSHLNDAGFSDLLTVARKPFVATHSNSRSICNVPRNLTDDQFKAIRDAGGIVGLNFYRGFIAERFSTASEEELATLEEATFDELAAHVEHFLDLGGENTLALGSDYDGSTVPEWLDGCEKIPSFYESMCDRFGTDITHRIFYKNAEAFFSSLDQA